MLILRKSKNPENKMRKISMKGEQDRKRKRNNLILGIVLIAVMSFSVLGYGLGSFGLNQNGNQGNTQIEPSLIYNGFEFFQSGNFWLTSTSLGSFIFSYNPGQVEKINSEIKNVNSYVNKPLYIFSENSEAKQEIRQNLASLTEIIQEACLEGENCEENLQVKTCSDNFIVIKVNKEIEKGEITQQDNCVFVQSQEGNLIQTVDEFLFKILGIEQ